LEDRREARAEGGRRYQSHHIQCHLSSPEQTRKTSSEHAFTRSFIRKSFVH